MKRLRAWLAARRGATGAQGLADRYGRGERDFAGVSLKDCPDLVGIGLSGADLSGGDLSGACLAKARLDGACLRSADLRRQRRWRG